MEFYRSWIADAAGALAGPQLAVGHVVDETGIAVLRNPPAQVGAQAPVESLQLR